MGVIEPQHGVVYLAAGSSDLDMQAGSFEPLMDHGGLTYGRQSPSSSKTGLRPSLQRKDRPPKTCIAQQVVRGIGKGLIFKQPQQSIGRRTTGSHNANKPENNCKTGSNYGQIYKSKMNQADKLKQQSRQPSPSFPTDKQIFQNIFMLAQKEKQQSRYSKPNSEKSSAKSSTKQIFLKRSLPKHGNRDDKNAKAPVKNTLKKQLQKFALGNRSKIPESRVNSNSKEKKSLNNSRSNGLTFRTLSSRMAEDNYMDSMAKKKSLALQNTKTSSFLQRTSEDALFRESVKLPSSHRGKRDKSQQVRVVCSDSYKDLYCEKLAARQMISSSLISPSPGPSREMTVAISNQAANLCTYNKNHQKMLKKGKK